MGVCGEGKKATTEHANDVVGEEAILLGGFCYLLSTSTGTNLSLHVPTRYISKLWECAINHQVGELLYHTWSLIYVVEDSRAQSTTM